MDAFDRPTMFLLSEKCSTTFTPLMTFQEFMKIADVDSETARRFYDDILPGSKKDDYIHAAALAHESHLWQKQREKRFANHKPLPRKVRVQPEMERRTNGDGDM